MIDLEIEMPQEEVDNEKTKTASKDNTSFEIVALTKDLSNALGLINSIVEKKNVISILANVKLEAINGKLILSGTDIDLYASEEIAVQVVQEGAITVSTRLICDIIRKFSDKEVTLKFNTETQQLEVISNKSFYKLATLPANEFPIIDSLENTINFEIPLSELSRIVEHTKIAICDIEARYNWNGIYLHITEENGEKFLTSASLDGHRLALSKTPAPEGSEQLQGIIIPKKACYELHKILKSANDEVLNVLIELNNVKIKFTCGNVSLVSKLIDGTFPNYSGFIPNNTINHLIINSKLLHDAVERASIVTVETCRAVKFIFSDQDLEVTAHGAPNGSAQEIFSFADSEIIQYQGEEISISFNPNYILDIMGVINTEMVEISFSNNAAPTIISSPDDSSSIFVIMPVKV